MGKVIGPWTFLGAKPLEFPTFFVGKIVGPRKQLQITVVPEPERGFLGGFPSFDKIPKDAMGIYVFFLPALPWSVPPQKHMVATSPIQPWTQEMPWLDHQAF